MLHKQQIHLNALWLQTWLKCVDGERDAGRDFVEACTPVVSAHSSRVCESPMLPMVPACDSHSAHAVIQRLIGAHVGASWDVSLGFVISGVREAALTSWKTVAYLCLQPLPYIRHGALHMSISIIAAT